MKYTEIILLLILVVYTQSQQNFCDCGRNIGYHFDIETGKCISLQKGDEDFVENCYQYQKNKESKITTCITCDFGFALNPKNNECLKHNLGKCLKPVYNNNQFKCNLCQRGYILDIQTRKCLEPTDIDVNCEILYKEEGIVKCHHCKENYYLDKDTKCQVFPSIGDPNFVEKCTNYEIEKEKLKCHQCYEHYYLNFKAQKCISIGDLDSEDEYYVRNCKEYSYNMDNVPDCHECIEGQYLIHISEGINKCQKNPLGDEPGYDENCDHYYYNFQQKQPKCKKCNNGYYRDEQGVCKSASKIIKGCSFYSFVDKATGTVCGACLNEFYSNDGLKSCRKCPVVEKPKPWGPQPKPKPSPEGGNSGGYILQIGILCLLGLILI